VAAGALLHRGTDRGSGTRQPVYEKYAPLIKDLPDRSLDQADLLRDDFLIAETGRAKVYYAPFEGLNRSAQVVIVGITPGWTQMKIAYEIARDGENRGDSVGDILSAVKDSAAFAGVMRANLLAMLDAIELPAYLGIEQTASLFESHRSLLHATSAVRHPVFVGDQNKNYTGRGPDLGRDAVLRELMRRHLLDELDAIGDALVVPLGDAVSAALHAEGISERRCLYGFPHPSGGNGYRVRRFAENRSGLQKKISSL
jgi:hypothetical protein